MGDVRVFYTEDSREWVTKIGGLLKTALGAEISHFSTNQQAQGELRKRGLDAWNVYILDNDTGGDVEGLDLMREVLAEKKKQAETGEGVRTIVISLCSSNPTMLAPEIIEEVEGKGGSVWFKYNEFALMTLWIRECLEEGAIVSRGEWLRGKGYSPEYANFRGDNLEVFRRFQRERPRSGGGVRLS